MLRVLVVKPFEMYKIMSPIRRKIVTKLTVTMTTMTTISLVTKPTVTKKKVTLRNPTLIWILSKLTMKSKSTLKTLKNKLRMPIQLTKVSSEFTNIGALLSLGLKVTWSWYEPL